jgi:hypothetical protein
MPEQTPEPLTDDRLKYIRDDEYTCFDATHRQMAGELIAARYRIAELKAVGESLRRLQRTADDWAAWFAAEKEHWLDRAAMTSQRLGRRIAELEAMKWAASDWAAWFAAERDYVRRALDCMGADRNVLTGQLWGSRTLVSERDDELAAARARIAELESNQAVLRPLIESLIDRDPCSFDHHGGCQAHGYLSLEPGELCPQEEAKQWLSGTRPAESEEVKAE